MSSALYRKYRPQSFSQMIGQNHIKITLQHELAKGDIGHAYLFCGPRGLGKTTSARLFAKSVNCEQRRPGESEPCNKCQSCLDITASQSVDIIEIDAASNTGVDNVRENIIENSRFNPIRSKYKVFIIDEVHMLSASAFNALLKIMEEPPEPVIFILCTTEIHKVPLTIISRCQRFDFKKVTGEQLIKRLQLVVAGEQKQVEEEVLKRIIANSEGCVRDAESLLAKVLSLGDDITADQAEIVLPRSDFESTSALVEYLAENNPAAAIELINRLMEDGVDLVNFVGDLLEFLRQMLLIKTSGRLDGYGIELSGELSQSLTRLVEKFNWAELVSMIEIISGKSKEIRQSVIPQLPLEVAVIMITQRVSGQRPALSSFIAPVVAKAAAEPVVASQDQIRAAVKPKVEEKKIQVVETTAADAADRRAVETTVLAMDPAGLEKNNPATSVGIDLVEVISKWPQIVQKLILTNFTLGSLLKISQPLKIDGAYLQIAVSSDFYRGRLESSNNRPIIEAAIERELGGKVLIKGAVYADIRPIEMSIDYGEEAPQEQTVNLANINPIKLNPAEEVLGMF